MAYQNFLLAVPEHEVLALRRESEVLLRPSLVVSVSHAIGSWVVIQPIAGLLAEAIDGGVPINDALWHPLRPPMFHTPDEVRILANALRGVSPNPTSGENRPNGWYEREIEKVQRLLSHACDRGECVVSVLGPPNDVERASRVRIPFELSQGS